MATQISVIRSLVIRQYCHPSAWLAKLENYNKLLCIIFFDLIVPIYYLKFRSFYTLRMSPIRLDGANIIFRSGPSIIDEKHLKKLSSEISRYRSDEFLTDIRIVCKDGRITAHKFFIVRNSKWIVNSFEGYSDNSGCIICPDFSTYSVSKVLELLYCGATFLHDEASGGTYSEIIDVINHFGFQV